VSLTDLAPPHVVRTPTAHLAVRRLLGDQPGGGRIPLLAVHGLGGSAGDWAPLMAELAADCDTAAVDLPGFGQSPPPDDGDYSPHAHASAVIDLLQAAGGHPTALIGNSLGGVVATLVAARRPDLVTHLVLVSPALPGLALGSERARVVALAVPGLVRVLSRAARSLSLEEQVDALLAVVMADPADLPPQLRAAAVAAAAERATLPYATDALVRSARGLVTATLRVGAGALWAGATRVVAPTLVIYGGQDRLVPPAVRSARSRFPDATVVVMPRVGHVAMLERPALVAGLVRTHLGAAAPA